MPNAPDSPRDPERLDAYRTAWQATGKLLREGRSFSGSERNCVFLNCRGGQFANVSAVTGLDFKDDGRALGVTDWDQDGDLDLWMRNRTGPRLRLMRNQTVIDDPGDDQRYVAFRLEGTKSNRDAIGARVEIIVARHEDSGSVPAAADHASPQNGSRLIQTLRAGDAFLSQSSKWLHFGLGRSDQIHGVIVRWPSGTLEQFSNVQPNRRYRIVEGQGEAQEVTAASRKIALTSGPQPTFEPEPSSRTFFSNRLPMPLLRYRPLDDDGIRTVQTSQQPLLLTLWASWCGPCLVELQAFAQHAKDFQKAGLRVLALSVDGLDQTHPTNFDDARAMFKQLQLPFAGGVATHELLEKLRVAQELLFNQQPGLAVPTSFLLDSRGGLAVVYQGPVEISQLKQDLRHLDLPPRKRRDLAIPMAGRWLSPPRQMLMRAVARVFQQNGLDEDYARYLRMDAEWMERQREIARTDEERERLNAQFASANFDLGVANVSAGDIPEAIGYFRQSVQVKPDHVEALANLGALLARTGNLKSAIDYLRRAVEIDPGSVPARTNLAGALVSGRRFPEAIGHYQALLEAQPNNAQAHSQLARSLLEVGRVEEAYDHLRKTVELNPKDAAASLGLAWIQSTSPVESLRDGANGVRLAERLKAASRGSNVVVLDVLAAAYAEQGNFDAAVAIVNQAIERLAASDAAMRSVLIERLKAYTAKKPHRDKDSMYP